MIGFDDLVIHNFSFCFELAIGRFSNSLLTRATLLIHFPKFTLTGQKGVHRHGGGGGGLGVRSEPTYYLPPSSACAVATTKAFSVLSPSL